MNILIENNPIRATGAYKGRLRQVAVGINGSVFLPLSMPQLLKEYFQSDLDTAAAFSDPFEQTQHQIQYSDPSLHCYET